MSADDADGLVPTVSPSPSGICTKTRRATTRRPSTGDSPEGRDVNLDLDGQCRRTAVCATDLETPLHMRGLASATRARCGRRRRPWLSPPSYHATCRRCTSRMAEWGDKGPESEHPPPRSTRGVSRWHTCCSTGTCIRPTSPAQDQCSPFTAEGGSTSSAASGLASRRRCYVSGDDESAAAECVWQAQGKGVRAVRMTHHEQRRHRREERWPGPLDLARLVRVVPTAIEE